MIQVRDIMKIKKYKPLVDKFFWIISVPVFVLVLGLIVLAAFQPLSLIAVIPLALFVIYFLVSSLFGYVELRESGIFIKYGLILKKEIPYEKIRGAKEGRGFYSDSMVALKNSIEHVNIKYNSFDVTTVSVVGNAELVAELNERCSLSKNG